MAGLTEILPLLDTGAALLLDDAVLIPTRIRLDRPKVNPASSTRGFWKEWSIVVSDTAAIAEAVETLRQQPRPSS